MIKSFIYRNFPNFSIWLRDIKRYGHEPEMEILSQIPHQGYNAVDVGAHLGNWTYKMSKLFDNVYSFEPNIFLSDLLDRSNLKNVIVHNIALSSNSGFSELNLPVVNGIVRFGNASLSSIKDFIFDHQITQAVKLNTLDSYQLESVGFIKIDVEGHELSVLKGALNTISTSFPIMIIEINNSQINTINSILDVLAEFFYKPYFLNENIKLSSWSQGQLSPSSNYIFISSISKINYSVLIN
jgi:FkbM family methyltransferase